MGVGHSGWELKDAGFLALRCRFSGGKRHWKRTIVLGIRVPRRRYMIVLLMLGYISLRDGRTVSRGSGDEGGSIDRCVEWTATATMWTYTVANSHMSFVRHLCGRFGKTAAIA